MNVNESLFLGELSFEVKLTFATKSNLTVQIINYYYEHFIVNLCNAISATKALFMANSGYYRLNYTYNQYNSIKKHLCKKCTKMQKI